MSTGEYRLSQHAFDNVTPGEYEETEQPFTYSMYTETVIGASNRTGSQPRNATTAVAGRKEALQSWATSNYVQASHSGDDHDMMTLSQRGDGYDTAMFA